MAEADEKDPETLALEESGGRIRADALDYGEELAPGVRVGEYVVTGTIATGGWGTVYTAHHPLLRRRAAVKVLRKDLASSHVMAKRFHLEAQAANKIKHPNVVDIFDLGILPDGRPYFLMEYLEGATLTTLVKRDGRMLPERVLEVLDPVLEALEVAHREGIVHRDLKSSNVMVATLDGREIVKLLDFGVAKLLQPEPGMAGLTAAGMRLGTPHAMAPEQLRDEPITTRTDIYSLGVLIHQLLTGRLPFEGTEEEIETKHLTAAPPRPSQLAPISPELDAVVVKCLEKKPERRFDTVSALRQALRKAVRPGGAVSTTARKAVAICVAVRVPEDSAGEDAVMDDVACVLDMATDSLRQAGYAVPVQTADAALGASVLADGPDASHADREKARALAANMWAALAERATADPRVKVSVCVHVDSAVLAADSKAIVDGDILKMGTWAPQDETGALVTEQAAEGLAGLRPTAAPSRYQVIAGG